MFDIRPLCRRSRRSPGHRRATCVGDGRIGSASRDRNEIGRIGFTARFAAYGRSAPGARLAAPHPTNRQRRRCAGGLARSWAGGQEGAHAERRNGFRDRPVQPLRHPSGNWVGGGSARGAPPPPQRSRRVDPTPTSNRCTGAQTRLGDSSIARAPLGCSPWWRCSGASPTWAGGSAGVPKAPIRSLSGCCWRPRSTASGHW